MWRRIPSRYVLLIGALVVTVSSAPSISSSQYPEAERGDPRQALSRSQQARVAEVLKETLESRLSNIGSDARNRQYVLFFYAARGYQPAWQFGRAHGAAEAVIHRMAEADGDGLSAADYAPSLWRERIAQVAADVDEFVVRDIELTALFFRFASDLAFGPEPHRSARGIDLVGLLASARDARRARAAVDALEPGHEQYRRLKEALSVHRELAAAGGWPVLPERTMLAAPKNGESGRRADADGSAATPALDAVLRTLCHRLAITGDLRAEPWEGEGCETLPGKPAVYNATLEAAVRHFQSRHGLEVDGIVGPGTVAALNLPAMERVRHIAANMHRWRRLPDDLGDAHVSVNVAGFSLAAIENGRTVLSMRVVAGEPGSPTPIMSDEIEYLEIRPYWNVPETIARAELLPLLARNPSYLHQQQFEVVDGWGESAPVVDPATIDWQVAPEEFPYRLRQLPGRQNALGLIKFMFPNDQNIYLHDTPSTHRFDEPQRAFSHGCVRVEDPLALAGFLLRDDPEWTSDSIREAMDGEARQVVRLRTPVPVHLTYFTAWVADGVVQFRADLYGLDTDSAPKKPRA